MRSRRVGILGLGLIGGSLGGALRRAGSAVTGYDLSRESARRAQARGLVHEVAPSVQALSSSVDTVILAVPVWAIVELLPLVDRHARPETLILDTGSAKEPVIAAMNRLEHPERAVGGHPIAGKEVSGIEAAEADLFRHAPFVLCAGPHTHPDAYRRAEQLVQALGARVVSLPAAEHDRLLAEVSHLPQVLSTALALSSDRSARAVAGPGFRDMVRLASSDPVMWRDTLQANRANVLTALRRYIHTLETIAVALEQGEGNVIQELVARGNAAVRQ